MFLFRLFLNMFSGICTLRRQGLLLDYCFVIHFFRRFFPITLSLHILTDTLRLEALLLDALGYLCDPSHSTFSACYLRQPCWGAFEGLEGSMAYPRPVCAHECYGGLKEWLGVSPPMRPDGLGHA